MLVPKGWQINIMDISKIKTCVCRFWKINPVTPASDGSIIPRTAWEEYLGSDEYREMIESGNGLGSLTHASRDLKALPASTSPAISKMVGKDDSLLLIESNRAPVWRLKKIYINDNTGWVEAVLDILPEENADEVMKSNILRLKTLVASGSLLPVSAVVVAFWDSNSGSGQDICKKLLKIKALDVTLCESMKGARIIDVFDSEGNNVTKELKTFSEKETESMSSGVAVVKTFSASQFTEFKGLPKTSKIGLSFTNLKVKQFSNFSQITSPDAVEQEKVFTVATVKDRVRIAKLSPRMSFRRLMIDYKQAVRAAGGVEKMDPEDVKIMKSLFTTDIIQILGRIHNDVMAGKQVATLIGASSISKNARQAAQKLQLPYKMAMLQTKKQGMITKDRFAKIQSAYADFVHSLIDEVFGEIPTGMKLSENMTDDDSDIEEE